MRRCRPGRPLPAFLRATVIAGALSALALAVACSKQPGGDAPPANKRLVVGFSQIGAESGWRTANTKSIKDEAEKRGVDLRFSDAQGDQENQVRALRSFIQQQVDVIAVAPKTEEGWQEVLEEAQRAGIPVILTDRLVRVDDDSLYVTFIGSDFVEEGRRAGQWLADQTGGTAVIAELQGTPGAAPTIDRKKGFEEIVARHPGMTIVKSQSGNFERSKGKEVCEAFMRSPEGPQITALYAHNDDMALGAIQAIAAAGRRPGEDVLVVSIDGVRDAFQAMLDGTLNCTVECNPLLGPQLFDTIEAVRRGERVPKRILTTEGVYDRSQVTAETLASRQY
ncbi:MAG: ABC transporter substrate-binding protein [Phycisphaerales bacterium]|nr:ABC transporter substrate-binding protein [Phycisphaerales bacterium]